MTRIVGWLSIAFLAATVMSGCGRVDEEALRLEVDAWHAERLASLRSETGWLSLVGLHPLAPGINTLGSAAGRTVVMTAAAPPELATLTIAGDLITFSPAPAAEVFHWRDGALAEPFTGGQLASDADGKPDVLAVGSLVFHVIRRGESHFLRVKDRQSAVLREFQGIDRYPVQAAWRVTARLEGEPGTMRVANVLGQSTDEPSPGVLVFKLAGQEYRLRPTGEAGSPLFIVFGDASNGQGTYPGGRFLVAEAAAADGTVVLDFNRAYNPPCAFTEFATCPLPGPEERLPLAILAGERTWGTGH